jgi:hypothetical protein
MVTHLLFGLDYPSAAERLGSHSLTQHRMLAHFVRAHDTLDAEQLA